MRLFSTLVITTFSKRHILITIFLFSSLIGIAQPSENYLLLNPAIQLETGDAINDLYNFKFESAHKTFNALKKKYPDHPMPYFLNALAEFWKTVPYSDKTPFDEQFLAAMDKCIEVGEKKYKQNKNNAEIAFLLAASYGLKGRFHADRNEKLKATLDAKSALDFIQKNMDDRDYGAEFLLGTGLYNYYERWLAEEFPNLRPILFWFKNGDKQLGLLQIDSVAKTAFYTRTEALRFLMNIYDDEGKDQDALKVAKYLHETFPDNPYFHRSYARLLYTQGRFTEAIPVCESLLHKVELGMTCYEENSGRYASYILGYIALVRDHDLEKAEPNFKKAVFYGEKNGATEMGYYLHSLSSLAQIKLKQGDEEAAKTYYEKIKNNKAKSHPTYKEATKWLKEH